MKTLEECRATSYRKLRVFIDTHRQRLDEVSGSGWKRAPAYTAVRKILRGLDAGPLEQALRLLASEQVEHAPDPPYPRRARWTEMQA